MNIIRKHENLKWISHECDKMSLAKHGGYGTAVNNITLLLESFDRKTGKWVKEIGSFWEMGNGEYSDYPVIACPFCGEKLENNEDK